MTGIGSIEGQSSPLLCACGVKNPTLRFVGSVCFLVFLCADQYFMPSLADGVGGERHHTHTDPGVRDFSRSVPLCESCASPDAQHPHFGYFETGQR